MKAKRMLWTPLALCMAFVALPVHAQEEKPEYEGARQTGEMDEMMAAYIEAGTPGAEHEWLASLAGDWNLSVTMLNMGPEPVTTEATCHVEMIHGGRFLLEQIEGSWMDQPFLGSNVTGYNNTTGMFEGSWIDNFSTALYTSTGTREGNTLTLTGKMKDPATGEIVKNKSVLTKVSPDRLEAVGYEDRGEGWQKTMEIVYTRKS